MFRKRIQDAYESLSPRFTRLADYILENTLDVSFLTATELSRRVSVDPATVVRFAQEIGYTGYRELSREIKKYINEQLTLRKRKGTFQQGSIEEQAAQIIDDISSRSLDMKVDVAELTQAAKIICEAQQIYITGTPEGYGLAKVWSLYLELIGLRVRCFEANSIQSALLLQDAVEQDVIVGIALGIDPGIELSRLFKLAKNNGVQTIAITTSPALRPAREADTNLITNAQTPFQYLSFDILAAQLSALWQIIILYKKDKAIEKIEQTVDCLDDLLQDSYRKSQYDPATLKRHWYKQGN